MTLAPSSGRPRACSCQVPKGSVHSRKLRPARTAARRRSRSVPAARARAASSPSSASEPWRAASSRPAVAPGLARPPR